MKAELINDELVIRLPIVKQPSASGKTLLVASTHGNIPTTLVIDGKTVVVAVNAYIKK